MSIAQVRNSNGFMRTVASVVLITFTTVSVSPGAQAIAQTVDDALGRNMDVAVKEGVNKEDRHSAIVERLKHKVIELRDREKRKVSTDETLEDLKILRNDLAVLDEEIKADFAAVEDQLQSRNLPAVILERHEQAMRSFETSSRDLKGALHSAALAAREPGAMAALQQRLESTRTKRVHQAIDPGNLPFRAPERTKQAPRLKSDDFAASFVTDAAQDVLLASSSSHLILGAQAAPVGPEYLAANEDVQIIESIRALAEELENDPVRIFEWVRNNIHYLPTYGSVQGSAMTLDTKQGNAFDTASLLIALLRAAGIPARYAYGTVEIPSEAVVNLTGNLNSPQAAIDLLAQGGIPVTALTQGGVIRFVRMEHIWVEAFVDFYPSRGARNRQADAWVPMDASFKRYEYSEGMQLASRPDFAPQRLMNDLSQNVTLNTEQGWSSGLNHEFAVNSAIQYQNAAAAYVQAIDEDASVDEIFGGRTIVQQSDGVLAASLPYKKVAEGFKAASLPSSLRAELHVDFFATEMAQRIDSPEFQWRGALPELAGKRVTLGYEPATDADRQLLESYVSTNSVVPAYLVRVQPVLRVAGIPVARGGSAVLGSDQAWNIRIVAPNAGSLVARNPIVAGTYTAIVPKLTTIMPQQFEAIEQRSRVNLQALQSGNADAVPTDDIVGEYLYLAGLGYWAQQDLVSRMTARAQQIEKVNRFALGLFSWEPLVQYSYGLPRRATAGGFSTDIDINLMAFADKGGTSSRAAIARILDGQIASHLEGSHWALARDRRDDPNTGFSTSQVFQHLSAQGARSYTLTRENIDAVLPSLPIAETAKADLRAGVNAGLIGIVNDRTASLDGWSGSGYSILDPLTGAGAYRINGGLNGGGEACQCFNVSLEAEFGLLVGISLVGLKSAVGGAILATVVSVALALNTLCQIDNNPCLSEQARSMLHVLVYLALVISIVGAIAGVLAVGGGLVGLVLGAWITVLVNYLSIMVSMITQMLATNLQARDCRP